MGPSRRLDCRNRSTAAASGPAISMVAVPGGIEDISVSPKSVLLTRAGVRACSRSRSRSRLGPPSFQGLFRCRVRMRSRDEAGDAADCGSDSHGANQPLHEMAEVFDLPELIPARVACTPIRHPPEYKRGSRECHPAATEISTEDEGIGKKIRSHRERNRVPINCRIRSLHSVPVYRSFT